MSSLRAANWTLLVAELHDPQGQAYLAGVGMVVSLLVCLFGNRSLWLWLSLSGFTAGFLSIYLLAPVVFDTDFCCGPGTEDHLMLISLSIGVFTAVAALWVLRIGLAFAGGGAGFGLALGLRPTLTRFHVLRSDTDFIILCGCLAATGAALALLRPKPLIVLATALAGAFGFCTGLSFFLDCHFAAKVMQAEETYMHGGGGPLSSSGIQKGEGLSNCNAALLSVWVALSIFGVFVQYRSRKWCHTKSKRHGSATLDEEEESSMADEQFGASRGGSGTWRSIFRRHPQPASRGRVVSRDTAGRRHLHHRQYRYEQLQTHEDDGEGTEDAVTSGMASCTPSLQTSSSRARRYVRQRLAEVLAEARRLRLDLGSEDTDTSDREARPHPPPRRARSARGGGKHGGDRNYRPIADESSEEEFVMGPLGMEQRGRGAGAGAGGGGVVASDPSVGSGGDSRTQTTSL